MHVTIIKNALYSQNYATRYGTLNVYLWDQFKL